MTFAYGYGRHLDQKEAVESFFKKDLEPQGIQYAGFYFDPETSAGRHFFNRTEAATLHQRIRPGDHLIVANIDSAFRSPIDAFKTLDLLSSQGVFVHALDYGIHTTTESGGKMIRTGLLVAKWNSRVGVERMNAVLDWKEKCGLPAHGKRPIGWKKVGLGKDSRYEKDEAEREKARRIVHLNSTFGKKTLGRDLHRYGITWRGRTRLNTCSILKIVRAAKKGFPLPNGSLEPGKLVE